MPSRTYIVALLLTLASGVSFAATPQQEKTNDSIAAGYERFIDSCAFCHGVDGSGNGDASELLSKQPSNLTLLSKNNDGDFPLEYVYNTIDGRKMPDSHGIRQMPVWGDLWTKGVPPEYAEANVRARIFEIIMYLSSIQE